MSFAHLHSVLQRHFEAGWTFTAVEIENVAFTIQRGEAYVRFLIREGERSGAAIPATLVRTRGLVVVDIFVPQSVGTQRAVELADQVAALLDYRSFVGDGRDIVLDCTSLRAIAGGSEPGWLHFQTSTPFRYDARGTLPAIQAEPTTGALFDESGQPLTDSTGATLFGVT